MKGLRISLGLNGMNRNRNETLLVEQFGDKVKKMRVEWAVHWLSRHVYTVYIYMCIY